MQDKNIKIRFSVHSIHFKAAFFGIIVYNNTP